MSKLFGVKGYPQDVVADADLPALTGSEKQVDWARRIRHDLLQRMLVVVRGWNHRLSQASEEQQQTPDYLAARAAFERSLAVMTKLEDEPRATWWIDHRSHDANELLQTEAPATSDSPPP